MPRRTFLTSESVTEGHPDKLCDQISDAVLDDVLRQDIKGRVACETFVTVGLVVVGGEVTTIGWVDLPTLVRGVIRDVGYNNPSFGFTYDCCAILNAIGRQSPDIAQGVDRGGAGDQGLMVGYACRETPQYMPLPIWLAHRLVERLAKARKEGILDFLGPDGKSQVTIEYEAGKPRRLEAVVVSCQHTEDILNPSGREITQQARESVIQELIRPVIPPELIDKGTKIFVNPTGKFVIGGPQSDTGMTGRKVIVDSYGGAVPHGGGAFSGKDPTKVDRSATYMARYIAKNIVAAGLAETCMVQLAYAIGLAQPLSVSVDTQGTGKLPDEELVKLVISNFELTPQGIIEMLDLLRPIYRKTSVYGHFGREDPDFTWESTDMASKLASFGR